MNTDKKTQVQRDVKQVDGADTAENSPLPVRHASYRGQKTGSSAGERSLSCLQ